MKVAALSPSIPRPSLLIHAQKHVKPDPPASENPPPLHILRARPDMSHDQFSPLNLPDPESDVDLVARAQQGDTRAFDDLVRKYTTRLYGLVYNMTSNRHDTEDLLQDIFAKAYRSIQRFMGKSSFYTWIYSIAVNMTLNFLKKRGRYQKVSLDDVDAGIHNDPAFIELTTNPKGTLREVNIHELQGRLNEAMMKLSEEHRTVVTLYDIQGVPHAEIARMVGTSEGTVRSRLFYAHRLLQNYLEEFVK